MIKSMTGYGRGIREDGTRKVTVEIKSVNHRYLDLNMKLPRKCNPLETQLRKYLASCIGRGKVDVYISLEESAEVSCRVVRNDSLAAMYLDQMRRISEKFHLEDDVTVSRLCAYPDILTVEDPQEDAGDLLPLVTDAIDAALYGPSILPVDVVFFSRNGENDRVWGKIGGHVFCYAYVWE